MKNQLTELSTIQERDFVPLILSTGEKCEEGVELCKHVEVALAEHHAQITQVFF